MANEMVPPFLKDTSESETLDLLHSPVDPYGFTVEKLRKLLSFAIRESMGMWLHI